MEYIIRGGRCAVVDFQLKFFQTPSKSIYIYNQRNIFNDIPLNLPSTFYEYLIFMEPRI